MIVAGALLLVEGILVALFPGLVSSFDLGKENKALLTFQKHFHTKLETFKRQ